MPKVTLGKPVPDIALHTTGNQTFKFSNLQGKQLVLYFYPKDNTSGCTTEGQDFRDHHEQFKKLKTEILGVSRDSLKSHEGFKAKHCFPFELVSDPDEKLCKLFGVIKEKSLYGKKYLGIERSTFLIDRQGVLRQEFRGVKVAGHVAEVLEAARHLSKGK
jgi:thioredoxin-dependent peroxiredoxin